MEKITVILSVKSVQGFLAFMLYKNTIQTYKNAKRTNANVWLMLCIRATNVFLVQKYVG